MKRHPVLLSIVVCFCLLVSTGAAAVSADTDELRILIDRAPVDPDGDVAGAPTDLLLTFRDIDPTVEGIGLKAGGTITVTLPEGFVDSGTLPFAATGSSPTCAPPLLSTCNTAVIVQGWPQSPVLPFPSVSWDAEANAVTLTAVADWLPAGPSSPGPKAVHLAFLGVTNPERAGLYRLQMRIQPDPDEDRVLTGEGRVQITENPRPALLPISLAAGSPPPPFPNPLFQTIEAGEPSLPLLLYLSDDEANAVVDATFVDGPARVRPIRNADGRRIGLIRVQPARGAREWSLESGGPSTA
ncbi:MAG: hypothetical protein AAGA65_29200, partial [Actinomycetota bacterium]